MQRIGTCLQDFINWIRDNADRGSVLHNDTWARTYFDAIVEDRRTVIVGEFEFVFVDGAIWAG